MRIRGKKIRTGISFKGKRKSKGASLEISINLKRLIMDTMTIVITAFVTIVAVMSNISILK
jgi:hypothetical protein